MMPLYLEAVHLMDKFFMKKKKNILFGPAINEAFQLEDKEAKNPRIVASCNVANLYNDYFQKCIEKFDKLMDDYGKDMQKLLRDAGIENLKESQGRIIIKDNADCKYIVNYLNSVKTVTYINLTEVNTDSMNFKKSVLFIYTKKIK